MRIHYHNNIKLQYIVMLKIQNYQTPEIEVISVIAEEQIASSLGQEGQLEDIIIEEEEW